MNTNHVFLRGGLGNQFFQWMHALHLLESQPALNVVLNTTFLRRRPRNQAAGQLELSRVFSQLFLQTTRWPLAARWEPLLSRVGRMSRLVSTDSPSRQEEARPHWFHYGYYQTPSSFTADVRQRVRSSLRPEFSARPVEAPYSAIHVRAGDYQASTYNRNAIGVLADDYYAAAAAALGITRGSGALLIVSDDPVVARRLQQRIQRETDGAVRCLEDVVGRPNTPDEALHYLIHARSLATANSSFSAMAAYLGEPKTVIAPSPWFRATSLNALDPSRPSWRRIPALHKT